jgi:hypothetical protein
MSCVNVPVDKWMYVLINDVLISFRYYFRINYNLNILFLFVNCILTFILRAYINKIVHMSLTSLPKVRHPAFNPQDLVTKEQNEDTFCAILTAT